MWPSASMTKPDHKAISPALSTTRMATTAGFTRLYRSMYNCCSAAGSRITGGAVATTGPDVAVTTNTTGVAVGAAVPKIGALTQASAANNSEMIPNDNFFNFIRLFFPSQRGQFLEQLFFFFGQLTGQLHLPAHVQVAALSRILQPGQTFAAQTDRLPAGAFGRNGEQNIAAVQRRHARLAA